VTLKVRGWNSEGDSEGARMDPGPGSRKQMRIDGEDGVIPDVDAHVLLEAQDRERLFVRRRGWYRPTRSWSG
jgi:hypothetical protein